MKLLASLALGTATFVAASLALTAPAAAGDDVTVGVRLGPLCVGLCIGGGHDGRGRRHHYRDADYDDDFDGGFYAHREDYYHQNYDRRDYADARDDGYASYRRRYASDAERYDDGAYDGDGRRGHHHGHHDDE